MQPAVTPRILPGTRLTLTLLLTLTVLATACASSATAGPAGAGSPAAGAQTTGPQTLTVQMNDANRFVPATLTVPVGSTVTWKNVGQVTHTVTADSSKAIRAADVSLPSGVQPWDSGNVDGGQSFSYTFATPGTYHYVCIPHEELGMVGTITVTN
jgi:plastocyanin